MTNKPTYMELEQRVEKDKVMSAVVGLSINAVGISDLQGKLIYVNDSCVKMWGYNNANEILGRSLPEFWEGDGIFNTLKELMEKGVASGKGIGKRKDGSLCFLEFSTNIIKDGNGNPLYMLGSFFDITKRKQMQEALKEANDIINRSPAVAFLWKNAEGWPVEFVSKNVEELFGYTADELTSGKVSYAEAVHPDDLERVVEEVSTLSKEKERSEFVHKPYRIITKNGEVKWLDDRTHIRRNEKGEITHFEGIVIDITDHIKAEEDKKEIEAKLQQAQKMEAIGTLAGGIAHDFNNLLTTIIANAHMMLMGLGKSDPLREEIEDIKNAGETGAALTRRLLAFSRRQVIQPVVLDLNQVLADLENILKRLIRENIKLKMVLEPGLWKVTMDPSQIEQVVMNLVVNTGEAMPHGGELTVETANVELAEDYFSDHELRRQTGPYVMLAVSDTGTGMDELIRSHIFEPFFNHQGTDRWHGVGLVHGVRHCQTKRWLYLGL